jgi:hypothetical protein
MIAEPGVNLPGPKPAPGGSNDSNRPNSISTIKSSRSTWAEWENGDTNYSIKRGGEWNGDATPTVTYQEGDDIHNSTHHDVAPTPIRESPERRSSTQLTANTTTPKDNSFFAAESDLFDEGYVLTIIEPTNKCVKIDSLNLKVRMGRHWKNGFRFHVVPLVSTWFQGV